MANISMKALLEAGVHFGHRTRRWDPKMKPYIFTERNGIHIIDLQQTLKALSGAYDIVRDTAGRGGKVLLVGTKRQAQDSIRSEAERAGMPYINNRWLGGTLTNFITMRARIQAMKRLEERQETGELSLLPKKEALMLTRELTRAERRFGGLRTLERVPDVIFIVDVHREAIAVKEANRLGIPIIGMVDTNSNPDPIDHVVPSNDDAIRAISLITSIIADAAIEGRQAMEAVKGVSAAEAAEMAEAEEFAEEEEYVEPVFVPELEFEEQAEEIDIELAPEQDIVLTTNEGMGPQSVEHGEDAASPEAM